MKENTDLKEIYRDKNLIMQARLEELYIELEKTKRQVVSIEEFTEDRNRRIESLRSQIDELTEKHNTAEQANSVLKVENTLLLSNYAKLEKDFEETATQLKKANQVRIQHEEQLND